MSNETTSKSPVEQPRLVRNFTEDDLVQCWQYRDSYLLQILNGEYTIEEARDDLGGLIGSRFDSRVSVSKSLPNVKVMPAAQLR